MLVGVVIDHMIYYEAGLGRSESGSRITGFDDIISLGICRARIVQLEHELSCILVF